MSDFTKAIADESDRFISASRRSDPADTVPTCPGWSSAELLWHLTEVHSFWAVILRTGAQTDEESEAAEAALLERPSDRGTMIDLYVAHSAAMLRELEQRPDEDPAWFWLDSARTVGAVRRMQAHEATMHRVDAELTAGMDPTPIDPELAGDGIEHAVEVMWAWWSTLPGFEFRPRATAVHLVATDVARSWQLQPGRREGVGQSGKSYDEPGTILAPGAETGATVSGTVEELDRWLWGRGPAPAASGDPASLDALREVQRQGMP